jgi:hypothetical protein
MSYRVEPRAEVITRGRWGIVWAESGPSIEKLRESSQSAHWGRDQFFAHKLIDHLFQFWLRSRCTAMLAGLRTLIQTRHGPD